MYIQYLFSLLPVSCSLRLKKYLPFFIVSTEVLTKVIFIIIKEPGFNFQLHLPFHVDEGEPRLSDYGGNIFKGKLKIVAFKFSEFHKDEDVIAHEIAHVFLGHTGTRGDVGKKEKDADDLIVIWGFNRIYQSYDGLGE